MGGTKEEKKKEEENEEEKYEEEWRVSVKPTCVCVLRYSPLSLYQNTATYNHTHHHTPQ